MDDMLTAEQRQLRDSAARLSAEHGGAKRARALRQAGRDVDAEAWKAMRDAGWIGILVPEVNGGAGLGMVDLSVVLEQIGRQTMMTPLLESAGIAALFAASAEAVAESALTAVLAGERIIAPAIAGDGWSFRSEALCIVATRRGGAWVMNGRVRLPGFAQSADEALLTVQAVGEDWLYLLPRQAEGLEWLEARNVDGSCAGTLALQDAPLDPARIVAQGLDAESWAGKLADLLALGSAIQLLGLSETALAITLEHVKTRRQFGQPLGSFQALQHRLADNFVDIALNRALLHRVCVAWDEGTVVPALVAAAKSRAARVASEVLQSALQLHGAIGYTEEHDIGTLWKQALALSARYGNALTQGARFARLTAEEA